MRRLPSGLGSVRYPMGPQGGEAAGALPAVAEFCRRLELAGIVDRACPVRQVAWVTHGQVIKALVALAAELDQVIGSVGPRRSPPSASRWPGCTGT